MILLVKNIGGRIDGTTDSWCYLDPDHVSTIDQHRNGDPPWEGWDVCGKAGDLIATVSDEDATRIVKAKAGGPQARDALGEQFIYPSDAAVTPADAASEKIVSGIKGAADTVGRLRSAGLAGWDRVEDPSAELRRIREGAVDDNPVITITRYFGQASIVETLDVRTVESVGWGGDDKLLVRCDDAVSFSVGPEDAMRIMCLMVEYVDERKDILRKRGERA